MSAPRGSERGRPEWLCSHPFTHGWKERCSHGPPRFPVAHPNPRIAPHAGREVPTMIRPTIYRIAAVATATLTILAGAGPAYAAEPSPLKR